MSEANNTPKNKLWESGPAGRLEAMKPFIPKEKYEQARKMLNPNGTLPGGEVMNDFNSIIDEARDVAKLKTSLSSLQKLPPEV